MDYLDEVADEDMPIIDTKRFFSTSAGSWATFDLTELLKMEDIKRLCLFIADADVSSAPYATDVAQMLFVSNDDNLEPSNHPILRITYRDYSPVTFEDSDDALTIEPYSENREYPLLKWGGCKDLDFVNFKVYRDTSLITDVSAMTPLATIADNSDQEYVDDTILTNGDDDGITYYYVVIAEDSNNVGNGATFSKNVKYTKPDITDLDVDPTGASNVGDGVTVTATASPDIKKLYVDWKDGSAPWYEFDTAETEKDVTHIYSGILSSTKINARVESSTGFWSSMVEADDSISMADLNPIAILIARPLQVEIGEDVRLNAKLSYPIANNETIALYKFTLEGGTLYDFQADPIKIWNPDAKGEFELGCYVRTTGGKTSTESENVYINVEDSEATEIVFSKDTKINGRITSQSTTMTHSIVEGGSGEIEIRTGLNNPTLSLDGMSTRFNMDTDLDKIRDAVKKYTYVKMYVYDEVCGKTVTYYGRLISYKINKTTKRYCSWSAEMRVITRVVPA